MIIKQTFIKGTEIECGEEFFKAIPDNLELQESISEVLNVIRDNITYEEYFVIQVDTDNMKADVVDVK